MVSVFFQQLPRCLSLLYDALLTDASCLTGEVAEVIETSATNATLLVNYYVLNEW